MVVDLITAMRVALLTLAVTTVCVRTSAAQAVDTFAQLPHVLGAGSTVYVYDDAGERTKGKITGITGSSISVVTRDRRKRQVSFDAEKVTRVTRVDSRLNGFVIGATAAAVPGVMLGWGISQYCGNEMSSDCPAAMPIIGGIFGLIGGWIGFEIDDAINGQKLIFARTRTPVKSNLRVSPIVARQVVGLGVSLKF